MPVLDYFTTKKPKDTMKKDTDTKDTATKDAIVQDQHDKNLEHDEEEPILNEEDEAFLVRITSAAEGSPPPLPVRPQDLRVAGYSEFNDAQMVLMKDARETPLPDVPDTPEGIMPGIEGEDVKGKGKAKRTKWSWLRRDSRDSRKDMAAGLHSAAQGLKAPDMRPNRDGAVTPDEAKKEEDEMTTVLDQLNLAAVNNRVFSLSAESRDLLKQFNLVLKDLIHGVPTAYRDLESLLTNSENQLQKTFGILPPFLQQLIEKLPNTFTHALGPEILMAAAEKQGLDPKIVTQGTNVASKLGIKMKTPSLKDLVSKQGAIVAMLRSIMTFLRTRFPAFVGLNVLWSLTLFGKHHTSPFLPRPS